MSDNRTDDEGQLPASDPDHPRFTPEVLDSTVIAVPLLRQLKAESDGDQPARVHSVIIDLNLDYPGGRLRSREVAEKRVLEAIGTAETQQLEGEQGINTAKSAPSQQYLFARLVRLDAPRQDQSAEAGESADDPPRAIFRIWPDFPIRPLTTESMRIVKADAARAAFSARGSSGRCSIRASRARIPTSSSTATSRTSPPRSVTGISPRRTNVR